MEANFGGDWRHRRGTAAAPVSIIYENFSRLLFVGNRAHCVAHQKRVGVVVEKNRQSHQKSCQHRRSRVRGFAGQGVCDSFCAASFADDADHSADSQAK